jgi:hypothetical protein
MNFIYTQFMNFLFGQAVANSDRIKVAVMGVMGMALAWFAALCTPCKMIMTPELTTFICNWIGGLAVTVILGLTHRDIAAPGQTVPGAAVPAPPAPVAPGSKP